MEFVATVHLSILYYSASSTRPSLRDRVLQSFLPPSTARTMLSTTSVQLVQSTAMSSYPMDPTSCMHKNTRRYAGGGLSLMICDQCGQRWRKEGNEYKIAAPKASPTANTPLSGKPKTTSSTSSSRPSTSSRQSPPAPSPDPHRERPRDRPTEGLVASAPQSARSSSRLRPRSAAFRQAATQQAPVHRMDASDTSSQGSWARTSGVELGAEDEEQFVPDYTPDHENMSTDQDDV